MKKTIVVTTDLGGYKAFRLEENSVHNTPRLEPLEEFNIREAHQRIVDQVTDLSGRFPRATAARGITGAMSDGERHNIELEWRKRLVRRLARRLNGFIRETGADRVYLAAGRQISRLLLDELDESVRGRIEKHVQADLTKTDKSELLRHFMPGPRARVVEGGVSLRG